MDSALKFIEWRVNVPQKRVKSGPIPIHLIIHMQTPGYRSDRGRLI